MPVPKTLIEDVPFRIVKRGGRKEMQLLNGPSGQSKTDNTLVKALARPFRCKRMLESGGFANIAELAEREGIAPTYMARVLRLSLLAPQVVDAILSGEQPSQLTLAKLMKPFSLHWVDQSTYWLVCSQDPDLHASAESNVQKPISDGSVMKIAYFGKYW